MKSRLFQSARINSSNLIALVVFTFLLFDCLFSHSVLKIWQFLTMLQLFIDNVLPQDKNFRRFSLYYVFFVCQLLFMIMQKFSLVFSQKF